MPKIVIFWFSYKLWYLSFHLPQKLAKSVYGSRRSLELEKKKVVPSHWKSTVDFILKAREARLARIQEILIIFILYTHRSTPSCTIGFHRDKMSHGRFLALPMWDRWIYPYKLASASGGNLGVSSTDQRIERLGYLVRRCHGSAGLKRSASQAKSFSSTPRTIKEKYVASTLVPGSKL